MADDSMEISSEHGHNDGDGDIDIDFDFTSAAVDEDYVLDDAAVTGDFGQNSHPQPSPAIANDDLMIDEDVDTYPMDDADLLHGEAGTFEDEALHFDTENSLHLEGDLNHGVQFVADDHSGTAGDIESHEESSEAQVTEKDISEETPGDALQQGDLHASEVVPVSSAEKPSTDLAQHESQTASPAHGSQKSTILTQEPRSPPASSLEAGPNSPKQTSEHQVTNLTSPSSSAESTKAVGTTNLNDTTAPASPQDVLVVYRNVEYALFSSSELDDPDSFFLSDISISDKPLAELFKAIRQIIKDDLNDEDELCMAVEDLGIEVEEVSSPEIILTSAKVTSYQQGSASLQDVTLQRILKLRENLQHNDGVESPPPMCILLGTRTSFFKRLEKLTAGAAEGKGLSQFITWEASSESPDDEQEVDTSKAGKASNSESEEEPQIAPSIDEEEAAYEDAHDPHNSAPEEAAQEYEYHYDGEEHLHHGDTDDTNLGFAASNSGNGAAQLHTTEAADPSIPEAAEKNESPSNEQYDEDDLIDYSEEEWENEAPSKRQAISHSNAENRTNQEYEAINEDLRRRSLSRSTEDKSTEPSNNQAPSRIENNLDDSYVEGNGDDYEEKHEQQDEFHSGDLNAAYDDFTTGQFDGTGSLEQYDGAGLSVDVFGQEGEFIDDGAFGDSFDVFGTEAQEYNYGEGTFENDGDSHSLQQNEADPDNTNAGADVTEQIDTAESSVTVAADEIQYEDEDEANDEVLDTTKTKTESRETNAQLETEHEDEIDYDNEDEVGKEKEPEGTTPTKSVPILPSPNGKRSRADVESDDAMTTRDKEAKRPRS